MQTTYNAATSPLRATIDAKNRSRVPTGEKVTGEHGLNWERPKFSGGLRYPGGYCGHIMPQPDPPHALEVPMQRTACNGYSGFRPGKKEIIGKPIVSLAEERGDGEGMHVRKAMESRGLRDPFASDSVPNTGRESTSTVDIREMLKNVDTEERYANAKAAVEKAGQSEEMLVQIVQSKLGSRVNSYAEQHIIMRLIFESFDMNGDGVLDENEFSECLERINIQFSDEQVLTLFAKFDTDRSGLIKWETFQDVTMVHNPKGGTAVLPKQICMTTKYLSYH